MAKILAVDGGVLQRSFLATFVLVVNAFSWYFPLYVFFENTLRKFLEFNVLLGTLGIHYAAVIGFATVGTTVIKRFASRSTILCVWMFIGVVSSAMMIILDTSNIAYLLLVSFLLGISLGLGFPSCLAYFGDHSKKENRGRLGGITFCASGFSMLLVGLFISTSTFAIGVLILTVWRGLGLILFLLVNPKQECRQSVVDVSFRSVLVDRSFVLYLVPWIMFCLVNFLEIPMLRARAEILFEIDLALLFPIAEFGIGGFVALVSGWFVDSIGRKRVVIFGFIVLGIAYALLGLFSNVILSWYLLIMLDGIAWGIFSLIFYMVIWADLAGNRLKEKHYLVGILPFLISAYLQILFTPYAELIDVSAAFSLASLFLFLAVLPLLYAPETLPERVIRKRHLQKYLEDVKKVKKKYEKDSDNSFNEIRRYS